MPLNNPTIVNAPLFINLLVNGGLEIWQRGIGPFSSSLDYTADRWQIVLAGTDTMQVDREPTTKQTDSLYSAKIAFVLGDGAGATNLRQALVISDQWHGLLGKTVSLRASIKLNAGVLNAVRAFVQTDGTGGTTTYSSYHGNNTNWENLDVVGVTIPTDATYVRVGLMFADSVTAYLDDVMLVYSDQACAYEGLPPTEEWARCQRYYEIQGGVAAGDVELYGYCEINQTFATTMHMTRKAVIPTITVQGSWSVYQCTGPVVTGIGRDTFNLEGSATATGTVLFQSANATQFLEIEANP